MHPHYAQWYIFHLAHLINLYHFLGKIRIFSSFSPEKKALIFARNIETNFLGKCETITKTYLYNINPLKPHFYIVKQGFTGVYIIFLFLLKNIDCGYSLEPPRRGGSNEYLESMFRAEIRKYQNFSLKTFSFLVVTFSIYLNMRVFVMIFQNVVC